MVRAQLAWIAVAMALAVAASCGDDQATATPQICEPGSTRECVGPGQCDGAQQCRADGTAWGSCDCGAGGAGGHGGDVSQGGDGAGGAGGAGNAGGQGGGLPSIAFFEGTVRAPEGDIPIHNARVYATRSASAPRPDGVYCDRCSDFAPNARYALTAADGSFTVGVPELGGWNLVITKGAFRRIRPVVAPTAGTTVAVPAADTRLPAQHDPSLGDTIPKIAVSYGSYDPIQLALQKFGLEPGVGFDVYEDFGAPAGSLLLTDSNVLESYHVVLFPCADSWPNAYVTQPAIAANVRSFVEQGGRLYASDWSYDIPRQVFAAEAPIGWLFDDGSPDSAQWGVYDSLASPIEPGIAAWLSGQGHATFTAEDSWTAIDQGNAYQAPNEFGNVMTLAPTTWFGGPVPTEGDRPLTMSFQYGCGRVLYSTFHSESDAAATLLPQELALLGVLFETGDCVGDLPPSP